MSVLSLGAYADCAPMFKHEARLLHSSSTIDLCDLTRDKTVLVVNTASHCGFTGQFKGLQSLSDRYKARGLVVIGFASNDFNQEAKSEEQAAVICYENYGVDFTMIAPGPVKGPQAHPTFKAINQSSQAPSWNFTKYLVDERGQVQRFDTSTSPLSDRITQAIEQQLLVTN